MRHILLSILAGLLCGAPLVAEPANRFPDRAEPRRRVTDHDLARYPTPERIETLILRGGRGYGIDLVTDAGAAHLPRFTNLRVLRLGGFDLTDRALEPIGKLTKLEEL